MQRGVGRGTSISIDIDGARVLHRELIGMGSRAVDVSPAMRDVRAIVYESNRQQFATEGAHGGSPWTPPSEAWTRRKADLGLDTKTEQATGDLRASLTGRRRGSYSLARKNGLDVGTTVEYAKYARKRNLLVSPTEAERRQMVRTVQAFVVGVSRARGSGSGILGGSL